LADEFSQLAPRADPVSDDIPSASTTDLKPPVDGEGRVVIGEGYLVRIYPPSADRGLIRLPQERFFMGRGSDCQLAVEDTAVSRVHAYIDYTAGRFVLVDHDSLNGTFVKAKRVRAHLLEDGDVVQIGGTILKFLAGSNIEAQYHETLYEMLITDGLTGIHNKRFFTETLSRELVRSRRRNRPLSLVLFDFDHFKQINDQHGHLAGDAVLRDVIARIKPKVRQDEVLARYGGEEFAVLLPESTAEEAFGFAERIRLVVCEQSVFVNDEEIPASVSIGVATTDGRVEIDALDLIAQADRKLYEAKVAGRNCVRA
jgi:diguanylate cyclase (GGDEF)-like protein